MLVIVKINVLQFEIFRYAMLSPFSRLAGQPETGVIALSGFGPLHVNVKFAEAHNLCGPEHDARVFGEEV